VARRWADVRCFDGGNISAARKCIKDAQHDEAATQMLLEIRKVIVEETILMNPAFDCEGLDEEVAQALLDLSHYGERHRSTSCATQGRGPIALYS
jgi:hypothetical protein